MAILMYMMLMITTDDGDDDDGDDNFGISPSAVQCFPPVIAAAPAAAPQRGLKVLLLNRQRSAVQDQSG